MRKHLFAVIALLGVSLAASAQRIMKIEKTDGTVVEIPVTDITRVFFEEPEPPEEPDEAVMAGLCPDNHHPHIIDLGSCGKWSCCNVGASSPEQYGSYYAWGETQLKSVYNSDTYQYYDSSLDYPDCYINIGSDISGTQYDAATVNWGTPWRMPTQSECEALFDNCTSEWTTVNGVSGCKFTGSTGGSIFLPAVGYRWDGELVSAGDWGRYWSSTLFEGGPSSAYRFDFTSGLCYWNFDIRYVGRSVRPVCP